MKKTTLILITLCLSLIASAQNNWQWGAIGGSQYSYLSSNHIDEWLYSMTTDPNGNVYAIASGANRVYVGKDSSMDADMRYVFVSWDCSGKLRWLKTLGPSFAGQLGADTLGGIYLTGYMDIYNGSYFDRDTVIAPQHVFKGNYIIKYDTSGRMKWLRMPDPPATSASSVLPGNRPEFLHMKCTPGGDIHVFSFLAPGTHADGAYPVTDKSFHILKYNKDGNFTGGMKLPLNVTYDASGTPQSNALFSAKFEYDPGNGRYYVGGTAGVPYPYPPDLFIGSDSIRGGRFPIIYLASFDRTGNLKWLKKQDTSNVGNLNGLTTDKKGQVYLAGQVFSGSQWNGATFSAPVPSLGFVACMDSNGVNKWVSSGHSNIASESGLATAIAVNKDNVVRVAGGLGNVMQWGSFTLTKYPPPGSTRSSSGIYFASLDPVTGACIALDSLRNKQGYGTDAQFMSTDRNGNFFIGGRLLNSFAAIDTLITIGPSKLVAIGGDSDFFVAKYGKASCKPVLSISRTTALEGLTLFPNPATNTVTVSGIGDKLDYALYNNVGSNLMSGQLTSYRPVVSVDMLPAGFYYIELRDKSGAKATFKIVKQ